MPMPEKATAYTIEINSRERVEASLEKAVATHASACGCLACSALRAVWLARNAIAMLDMGLQSDWLIDESPAPKPPSKPTGNSASDGPYRDRR
jgi:hypothetical protein